MLIILTNQNLNAQRKKTKKELKKEHIQNITKDSINGIYIPIDLDDCFRQIDGFWADSIKTEVKKMSEDEFTVNTHFGMGMWMRNNWKLWGGSRLSKYFNDLGVFHPDDMSGIILTSYYRYLLKLDVKLEEQIKGYNDFWKENHQKK